MFSITPWIAGSFTFAGQNWWDNTIVPEGKLTETIEAVQPIPAFVRRFSWEGPETSQPPPEPKPEPKPEPVPVGWNPHRDTLGVRLERKGGWQLVAAVYQDESEAQGKHHIFVKALQADGSPARDVRFVADWKRRRADENPAFGVTDERGETNMPMFIGMHPDRKDGIIFATSADAPGDTVRGMGLPNNHHVCFVLTFRLTPTGTADP